MPKISDIAIEATSVIVGTGTAYKAGDPSAGYAVSDFLNNHLRNLLSHFSSQRQSKRLTDVTKFSINEIIRKLENGEKLRDDEFFDTKIDRSDAEEVLEAVLHKAKDEPEEKKIPYIGGLYVSACFDSHIDSSTLHFLCKESDNLTYRQLCIIKIANEIEKMKYPLRSISVEGFNRNKKPDDTPYVLPTDKLLILTECVSLCTKEYITAQISHLHNVTAETWYVIVPKTIQPLPTGKLIYEHMKLKSIPAEDVNPIVYLLS